METEREENKTREKVRCKFCSLYNDFEGRCTLCADRKFKLDELHDCWHRKNELEHFEQLVNAFGDLSARIETAIALTRRYCNTGKADSIVHELEQMSERLSGFVDDISKNPDTYREIQDGLGTCGDCAMACRDPDSWYLKCQYVHPCYNGEVREKSWRGCAQWRSA